MFLVENYRKVIIKLHINSHNLRDVTVIVYVNFSGKFASFVVLCEKYELCIKRDPSYTDYLERISQIFFNVKPPRTNNANSGFFGNISLLTFFLPELVSVLISNSLCLLFLPFQVV